MLRDQGAPRPEEKRATPGAVGVLSSRRHWRCEAGVVAIRARATAPQVPVVVAGEDFRSDYADGFIVERVSARPPEAWARQTLEQGPAALRWFVTFGWRYVLGLHLARGRSADHVAGWRVVRSDADVVVLAVDSGMLGRCRLTFTAGESSATAGSNLEFTRPGARAIWSVAGLLHRRILPSLFGHAARSA
ncbi:MAG TPA: hypothetical protein VH914_20170 [Acidimicrobiia bacterium]|nr:hypothetical protein [Acidimicrobiia bacterium]